MRILGSLPKMCANGADPWSVGSGSEPRGGCDSVSARCDERPSDSSQFAWSLSLMEAASAGAALGRLERCTAS